MSIFISIASYEDKELEKTIRSAIENADSPDELFFGLALSYKKQPDLRFLLPTHKKVIEFDPDSRPGISKKRYMISQMFDNQDYFLQIDSHTTFLNGWDTKIINQLNDLRKSSKTSKVIISGAADHRDNMEINYLKIHNTISPKLTILENNNFLIDLKVENFVKIDKEFTEIQIMTSGLIFTNKDFINEVKFDKHSHTLQEQSYLSFRSFMKGWKIYRPNKLYILHTPVEYYNDLYNNDLSKRNFASANYINEEQKNNILKEMNNAMLYNIGGFAVDDPEKSIEDWWNHLGLYETYIKLTSSNFN